MSRLRTAIALFAVGASLISLPSLAQRGTATHNATHNATHSAAHGSSPAASQASAPASARASTPAPSPTTPYSAVDDAGRTVTLNAPAERIITLAPHLTELVAAAGGGDRLVGVSRFSDYPTEVSKLPVVSDAYAVNLEALAQLKPDLIVAWRSGMNRRQLDRITTLGVPVYISEVDSVPGIATTLQRLGKLMGTSDDADDEARRQIERWQTIQKRYAGRAPVRVFYQVSAEPLMTVNAHHIVSQAMADCGGQNVFAGLPTLVATVSWEAAAQADPQLIVTGDTTDRKASLGLWPGLPQVSAVRTHQYAWIDPALLSRMGPRFIDGAAELCAAVEMARRARP